MDVYPTSVRPSAAERPWMRSVAPIAGVAARPMDAVTESTPGIWRNRASIVSSKATCCASAANRAPGIVTATLVMPVVVKPGDSGMKIANANGVSLGDLQAVNPGVNWNGLKPGQKLKLPKK